MSRTVLLSATVVLALVAACGAALLVAVSQKAEAAFPGAGNGKLVYSTYFGHNTIFGTKAGTEIFAVDPDGKQPTNLTNTPPECVPGPDPDEYDGPYCYYRDERSPRWSPDGTKIAYGREDDLSDFGGDETWDIWVMNPDGSGQTKLTHSPDGTRAEWPSWSPDGTKIAFHRRTPDMSAIATVNADGTGEKTLFAVRGGESRISAFDDGPVWSPDGRKIAFLRNRDSHGWEITWEINIINADGSGLRTATIAHTNWSLDWDRTAWSPNGRKIAYMGARGGGANGVGDMPHTDIYTMNADGSGQTNLTDTPATDADFADESAPTWSPNGKKIAFVTDRKRDAPTYPHRDIYTMNADGSGKERLTEGPPSENAPTWSPDGKEIASIGRSENDDPEPSAGIQVMNADGSPKFVLASSRYIEDVDWQPLCPCPDPPADVTTPDITSSKPSPGSRINNRTPLIRATVLDAGSELAKGNIELAVDGVRRVRFSYDPQSGRLSYEPSRQFSLKMHRVQISATDAAGNRAVRQWSFEVVGTAPTVTPLWPVPDSTIADRIPNTVAKVTDAQKESRISRGLWILGRPIPLEVGM